MAGRLLLIGATLLSGLLAGATLDRLVVQMPAWRRVGSRPWAAYSRHADLGNGLLLYPVEAIGGAIFSIAAAIACHRDAAVPRSAEAALWVAVAAALGGLLATTQAAPRMLGLRKLGDDPVALQRAFEGFDRWGAVRGALQMLVFLSNLWAVAGILRSRA